MNPTIFNISSEGKEINSTSKYSSNFSTNGITSKMNTSCYNKLLVDPHVNDTEMQNEKILLNLSRFESAIVEENI